MMCYYLNVQFQSQRVNFTFHVTDFLNVQFMMLELKQPMVYRIMIGK